jgi:hypothetical protein
MGNWIKMRHDLYDDPDTRKVARATGLDRDQVCGKLYRLWSWADRHGHNGLVRAELEDVDDEIGHVGFGAALVSVGWLETPEGGIVIPHWERHFSDSAKVRGLAGQRAEKHRNSSRNAKRVTHPPDGVTQGALPEERRVDNPPPPHRDASHEPAEAAATLRAAWSAAVKAGHGQPYRAKAMPDGFADRLREPGWLDEALQAIDHLPRCRYFSTPATLIQLCGKGFVTKVLAGQFNDREASKAGRAQFDDRPPLRVDPAFEAARLATLDREAKKAADEHRRLDEMAATRGNAVPRPRLKLVNQGEAT